MALTVYGRDVITFFDEEFLSTENVVSFADLHIVLADEKNFDQDKKFVSFVSEIPLEQYFLLFSLTLFLSFSLNLVVLLFYRKSKEVTRLYILALVALDWIIVTLVLIPYTLVAYGGFSDEVNVYLHFISTVTFNNGFGLYLFPSLFLALDRVFVIRFPLTFRIAVLRLKEVIS